ncbi:MAG: tripartite tricarboxylate transporter substrate binding protein [Proteobacteria bacterium]|nr:tripartite tricarboxylate transporter substrate binding protein [Burkholderiales bacterium]
MLALAASVDSACAQGYPVKSVRIITPFPAGGGIDVVARIIAAELGARLGQPFVVDNRSGAGGVVAAELAAKAPPDGYTLFLATIGTQSINPFMYSKLGYDPALDFRPITLFGEVPNVLAVHPSLPVKNVKELIAFARARPGQLSFASSGLGTTPHLSGELFRRQAKLELLHVPYKGGNLAFQDLLGGYVTMMFTNAPTLVPFVRSGRVKVLAVTSSKRIGALPDVPTLDEAGLPGFDVRSWSGLMAPSATPPEIVNRLHGVLAKALEGGEVRDKLVAQGMEIVAAGPDAFARIIARDTAIWGPLIKELGLKLQ